VVWGRLLYEQKGFKSITNIYHGTNVMVFIFYILLF